MNLLVHQFGMMQQNMLDQFHQTMMMMFEGFAALHREQSRSIREEFDQVRKLSDEIEALAERRPGWPRRRRSPSPLRGRGRRPTVTPRRQPRRRGLTCRPQEPIKRATPPPPDPEVDIHAQLCLKLSTIQSERQNRWQKILGMMSSRS